MILVMLKSYEHKWFWTFTDANDWAAQHGIRMEQSRHDPKTFFEV